MILEGVSPSVFHLGKTGRSQKLLWKGEAAFEADVPASMTFTLSDSTFFLAWVTMSSRKCWSWNCRHLPMRWKMKGDANGTPQVFQVVMAKRGISAESITMARAKQMAIKTEETRPSKTRKKRFLLWHQEGSQWPCWPCWPGISWCHNKKPGHQRFMFRHVLPACCLRWLAQESTIKHSYIWYSTFTSGEKSKNALHRRPFLLCLRQHLQQDQTCLKHQVVGQWCNIMQQSRFYEILTCLARWHSKSSEIHDTCVVGDVSDVQCKSEVNLK